MSRDNSRGTKVVSAWWVGLILLATATATEATAIFANGRGIAHKGSGGLYVAFPDVTLTPCQPPTCAPNLPIPFPNIGLGDDAKKTYKTKIPTTKTVAKGESVKLGVPYDVFLPAAEFGLARIYLADPITGDSFGPDYELILHESSSGQFIVDLTPLPVTHFDIVIELSLLDGGSEPDTRLLIPFLEGVGLTSVPEPSSLLLVAAALLGLAGFRARTE